MNIYIYINIYTYVYIFMYIFLFFIHHVTLNSSLVSDL